MIHKGFTNTLLILTTIVIVAVAGYFILFNKSIIPLMSQKATQQQLQQSNEEDNGHGIVSFVKDDTSTWPLEWHITLSPDDTQNNEFQIISKLKTERPSGIADALGVDKDILLDILVDKREVQPKIGNPVDIKFLLDSDSRVNPSVLGGYQYLSMTAGFSRLGGFTNGSTSNSVTPYGTSFPIYMLGNKVTSMSFVENGNFVGSKILIATLKTSDGENSYIYEIFLEKTLIE